MMDVLLNVKILYQGWIKKKKISKREKEKNYVTQCIGMECVNVDKQPTGIIIQV